MDARQTEEECYMCPAPAVRWDCDGAPTCDVHAERCTCTQHPTDEAHARHERLMRAGNPTRSE